ncbi:hypothetical protein UCDDS831_g07512 [Diplodia seriata]|uniref:Uncharacterized protein n=1 Tax=Diplodia seriata TaxID=420778 RepID=A0A0G2DYL0_9PEZI|nr:hypothetical protein UCDDS831_g07512 [Diplodia seriata]
MSTTTSTKPAFAGLLASKWATKPSESDARKNTAAPKVPSNTGLHKSRWSPEPTTASQPTSPTGPEPAKPEQIEEPAAELEDAREPLLELLPATTPQPYQKKSWADLVDEDDNDVSFDLAELNKENFAPQPATTIEATITKPKDSKENTPPQQESDEQTITTVAATAATATNNNNTTTTTTNNNNNNNTTKHAPASMLSSRWSDASYEIQGAQTRAEYRATHESTNNARRTTRTSGNRRRRAN